MTGAMLTCPLEVMKTQLQSKGYHQYGITTIASRTLQSEGVFGFWKGIGPMLVAVVPARGVYFWTYNSTKGSFLSQGYADEAPVHLASAVVAGGLSATIINPVWVVKTRLQLQSKDFNAHSRYASVQYKGSIHAVRQIFQEEGARGFFKGLVPSYWGISESALHFVLYEYLKNTIHFRKQGMSEESSKKLSNLEYLSTAAIAKFAASVSTYPHEVIRTRMRERGASEVYKSSIHCVRKIWIEEGMRGLYGGLFMHLLRVVPNTAILFFTYEKVSAWLSE